MPTGHEGVSPYAKDYVVDWVFLPPSKTTRIAAVSSSGNRTSLLGDGRLAEKACLSCNDPLPKTDVHYVLH